MGPAAASGALHRARRIGRRAERRGWETGAETGYKSGPDEEATRLEPIGIGARLWLAFVLPWKLLFDGDFAARVQRLDESPALPPGPPEPEKAPAIEAEAEPDLTPALQLLAIMQREGRFVDFLQEDVASFSDAEIGAAARVVHEGCKRGLSDYLDLAPVRTESEGEKITLEAGFDARRTRVTGNVVGEPPFTGTLAHHGWRVAKIRLPELSDGHDASIVAPAEVEVQ
jgi:hypothetical protein